MVHVSCLHVSGDGVSVYLADIEKDYTLLSLLENTTLTSGIKITSVVPADFDGDLQMDILVTFGVEVDARTFTGGRIYWGNGNTVDKGKS